MDDNATPGLPISERLRNLLTKNLWMLVLLAVSTLISSPLAIYLYVASIQEPGLTYSVRPVRSVIAQAGAYSDLTVQYKSQPIASSVTAASIALWNDGKKPALSTDLLSPVQFHLPPGHRILEAKILRTTRNVLGFELDQTHIASGVLGIRFKVLEHDDGALIQVIYEGDQFVRIDGEGSAIGQPSLIAGAVGSRREPTHETPDEEYRGLKRGSILMTWVAIFCTFIFTAMLGLRYLELRILTMKGESPKNGWRSWTIQLGISLAVIISFWYNVYSERIPTTPFDFG
jgi:hypothetical protein